MSLLRYCLYTLCVFAYMLFLPHLVKLWGATPFYENGVVEWCQFACLLLAILLLLDSARRHTSQRALVLLLAAPLAFAATRELDNLFDRFLPFLGWKVGGIFLLLAIVYFFLHCRVLWPQILDFSRTAPFALLWAGFIIAIPLAQLLGHRPLFIPFVMAEHLRPFKRILEESIELIGYMLLLFGALEVHLMPASAPRDT